MFKNIDFLGTALSASWQKNATIASNIANLNTPGYKRIYSDFHSVLRQQLEISGSLKLNQTHSRHQDIPDMFNGGVREISSTSYRFDKNNVDIDVETAELAKNQLYYNTVTTELNNQLGRLKTALRINK